MPTEDGRGRPTLYTPEIATEICLRLADGESLRTICDAASMPSPSTICLWVLEDKNGFSEQYTRARQLQALNMADEIVDICDDARNDWMDKRFGDRVERVVDNEALGRSKLRVDTRKWLLSKMLPKVYGEKITNEISGGIAVTTEAVDRPPQETREEWIARRKRELAGSAAVGTATGATNGRNNGDVVR